jgi:carbon monoxide dehydrogenase subunit G
MTATLEPTAGPPTWTDANTVGATITIDARPEVVWPVIADLGDIQAFHPGVRRSAYISDSKEGVGAARVCEFGGGRSVEEHAIEWEEGRSFTLELKNGRGMPPFKRAVATMSVRPDGDRTQVDMELRYTLRFGLIGKLMDRMVRPQFERMLPAVLGGLKKQLEAST